MCILAPPTRAWVKIDPIKVSQALVKGFRGEKYHFRLVFRVPGLWEA